MKNFAWTFFAGLMMAQLTAFAAPEWSTDLTAAQAQAQKEKKMVFINFTGSDWCGWCKKLKSEVFDTKEFTDYAKQNLVLVEIDFPNKKKQSDELKKTNTALQKKYKAEGFPTLVVLDGAGNEAWRQVGYMPGGPTAWIAKLNSVKK
jgi:protein disulfide-isomerase